MDDPGACVDRSGCAASLGARLGPRLMLPLGLVGLALARRRRGASAAA